jgi:tetratricopeptide (TPR) repeat protein
MLWVGETQHPVRDGLVLFEDKKDKIINSSNQVINKERENETKKEVREQLDQIGDDTALGHLIKAQYLEELEYYAEAAMAYKAAIALAPDVETYKILYDSFTERTVMSEKAILGQNETKNAVTNE